MDEQDIKANSGKIHVSLSNSHRVAASIKLSFTFRFYGHDVKKVTIATGGFLYMSDFLHQWLTATQYIAPLMANFDTNIGNSSSIHYADSGSFFIVWWEDIYLQDNPEAGPFSFQTIIHEDGKIIFNYKSVPIDIGNIPKAQHPVKVGLSDAYYVDTTTATNMKRRTIYEYHRVEIKSDVISNSSSIILRPVRTCIEQASCESCMTADIGFSCVYCSAVHRCSDGMDRHRQEWLSNGCDKVKRMKVEECPSQSYENSVQAPPEGSSRHSIGIGAIVAILLISVLILVITIVTAYGYLKPQSQVGMWLIENRPSRLRQRLSDVHFFKRGDGNTNKYEVSMQPEGESIA